MIRTFPRNAVMERGILNAAIMILSCVRSSVVLQNISSIEVSFSTSVMFTMSVLKIAVLCLVSLACCDDVSNTLA